MSSAPGSFDPRTQVVVELEASVARSLHGVAPATPESEAIAQLAAQSGAALEPMHPQIEDPALVPFFTITAPDRTTADQLIQNLRQRRSVEAAYVKPPDEMP
jgi:hypothetical protein